MNSLQSTIVINIIIIGGILADVSVQEATYLQVDDPSLGMLALAAPWTAMSVTSCAVTCSFWFEVCYSFTYNHDTGLCTLGQRIDLSYPGPTPEQGLLYERPATCNIEGGFQAWSSANLTLCVFLSDDMQVFLDAAKACRDKDGHLLSLRSKTEFDLFVSKMGAFTEETFWVGLNDIQTEGQFIRNMDGSVLTSALEDEMFATDQPDNWGGDEDCVAYQSKYKGLNDALCSDMKRFVCEWLSD